MRADHHRPSIPALVLLVISAFAVMATSPAEFVVPGNADTTVELTQAQPAAEITFTSQFAAQPQAAYWIEWDRSESVDVTFAEGSSGAFDDASLSAFGADSVTVVVSALDPSALNDPLPVTFSVRSEHTLFEDPEDLTAPIKIAVSREIERPIPPLLRIRPNLNFAEIAHWKFTVSTDEAVAEDHGLIVSRRPVNLNDERNLRLWNQTWDPIPFPEGPTTITVPDLCLSGPCQFDLHLVLAQQSFQGLEFELSDGQGLDQSPFSVTAEEVPLLTHTGRAPWGPLEVKQNETTFIAFDVGLPTLEDSAVAPQVYFIQWNTDPDTDDDSRLSFSNDAESLERASWTAPGPNKITGGVSGFVDDDTEASGIMTVTVFTIDPLAPGEVVSVAVSP